MSFEVMEVEQEQENGDEGGISVATRQLARWVPPESLLGELPVGHEICFDLYIDADGNRRFQPQNGDWQSLIVQCFNTGLVLQGLDAEARSRARLNYLAFIWMKYRQDFATRRFLRSQDFSIRRNSRVVEEQTSVLSDLRRAFPELNSLSDSIGRTPESTRAFYSRLYKLSSQISLGEMDQESTLSIIRSSFLVHRNRLPAISELQLEEVRERFWLQTNRDLDGREFTDWLTSSRTNLPTLIKRMEGAVELNRPEVNSALFELGAQGLQAVALNFHVTMREIANSIGDLNEDERRLFDSIYLGTDHLAGFPLLTLMYRHDFLRPAVLDLWDLEKELDEVAPVVLNLLHFYSIMLDTRRAADRQSQRWRSHRSIAGNTATNLEINEAITEDTRVSSSLPLDLIERIGLKCNECNGQNLEAGLTPYENNIDFHFFCKDCESDVQEVSRPIEDLSQLFD